MKHYLMALFVCGFGFGSVTRAAVQRAEPSLQLVFDVSDMSFANLENLITRTGPGSRFDLKKLDLILNNSLQKNLLQAALDASASASGPQLIKNGEQFFMILNLSFARLEDRNNCLTASENLLLSETQSPYQIGSPPPLFDLNPQIKQTQIVALRSGEIDIDQGQGEALVMKSWHCTSQNPYDFANRSQPKWIVEKHGEVEVGAYSSRYQSGEWFGLSIEATVRPARCAN